MVELVSASSEAAVAASLEDLWVVITESLVRD